MALFLFTAMLLPSFAAGKECGCGNAPVIYVRGRSAIVNKAGVSRGTDPEVHTLPYTPDGFLEEKAKELIPIFAKAYLTNNYTEYNNRLIAIFEEVYADYRLDENGNVTNESGNERIQQLTGLQDTHKKAYNITKGAGANAYCYQYFFQYDIRLDPCAIAEDLHTYVESVKQVTGHSTVKFIARCMGTNILSAYFARYGWEDVEDVILYNPIVGGTIVTNAFFTGDLELDSQSIDFFAKQALEMDDTELLSLILNTIDLANANYSLGITTAIFNPLVKIPLRTGR